MARLTITLSDERYIALKEAAARQRKSIREIIESSLEQCGIKGRKTAAHYLARARAQSNMDEDAALGLAVREARAARKR